MNDLVFVRSMRRSFFEIVAEILQTAKKGAKKTRITNSCKISNGMTKEFLNYLLRADLLRVGNSFHTTEKGLQFLQAYQTLELLLNTRIYVGAHQNGEPNQSSF